MISFTVPGRPVPWKRARKNGKRHFTDPTMTLHAEMIRAAARNAGFRTAEARPFKLTCRFYFDAEPTNPLCGDVDNLEKLVADACQKIIWTDDRFVTCSGEGRGKYRDDEHPRTEVTVEPLPLSTPESLASILGEKAKTRLLRAKGRLVKSTRDYRRQP